MTSTLKPGDKVIVVHRTYSSAHPDEIRTVKKVSPTGAVITLDDGSKWNGHPRYDERGERPSWGYRAPRSLAVNPSDEDLGRAVRVLATRPLAVRVVRDHTCTTFRVREDDRRRAVERRIADDPALATELRDAMDRWEEATRVMDAMLDRLGLDDRDRARPRTFPKSQPTEEA